MVRLQTNTSPLPAGVQLEPIACPGCGGAQHHVLLEATDPHQPRDSQRYVVVECDDCGLAFTNPQPSEATIAAAYPAYYPPHEQSLGRRSARRRTGWSRWTARLRRRQQLPWQGEGRLLDFGCGAGGFLQRMHAEGWRVVGLDTSPAVVERIRSELGLPALLGSLPHPDLAPASFDVVTMRQSLEHVHAPRAVLAAARQLLVPGGRLIVSVPNFVSLSRHWFASDWFGLDLPRHLTHFTPHTLGVLVRQAGFRLERLEAVGHASWIQASAQRAAAHGVRLGWRWWLRLRPISRIVAWSGVLAGAADTMTCTAVAD